METYAYLAHHGIKGQKWGDRRYQYKDGSLTPEGRRRYGVGEYVKNRYNMRNNLTKRMLGVRKDETRKRVKAEYRAAVKAENKKLYKYGKNEIDKRARVARRTGKFLRSPSGLTLGVSNVTLTSMLGASVAMAGGSALIKLAMKRNPNLKLSSSDVNRLINVAVKNGINVGATVGAGVTGYEAYRYAKANEEKKFGRSSRKTSRSGKKANPWSEKPSNPYDYNWTERPSKNKSNI